MAKNQLQAEKIRNLTPAELDHKHRDLNDQLFRLKFQMKMGQTESLQKIRGLRKDIARLKTIARERQLAEHAGRKPALATAAADEKPRRRATAAREKS